MRNLSLCSRFSASAPLQLVQALALLVSGAPATAEAQHRWVSVLTQPGAEVYMDTASVLRGSDSSSYFVWFKLEYDEPQRTASATYVTMLMRIELQCANRRFVFRTLTVYDSTGKNLGSIDEPAGDRWMDLIPMTSGEAFMLAGCAVLRKAPPR